ncbi:MAG: S-methyl-5-thioribose-1-phosphate isomerase [Deltaproteobacteria bacterium]|nr:S-methyl-5-thioribose-1-phosphate isomerase [Deltaproteobacteria bacterium]
MHFKNILWENDKVIILDQRCLPEKEVYHTYQSAEEIARSIRDMEIRGAPAIGIAGAYGMALAAQNYPGNSFQEFCETLDQAVKILAASRPTAVNLKWSLARIQRIYHSSQGQDISVIQKKILEEAHQILSEDKDLCEKIGRIGASELESGVNVLTYCNTGALATGGWGTALAVFYYAVADKKKIHVYVPETRPYLQGARLTSWELDKNKIPHTLITDNMCAFLMKKKEIHSVWVGADRIVANGDVANKVGTYALALLAKYHQIPFYVAAPYSTIDMEISSGQEIPIEERPALEMKSIQGKMIAPEETPVWNPAFDITPHDLITAIVTEKGFAYPSFYQSLKELYRV